MTCRGCKERRELIEAQYRALKERGIKVTRTIVTSTGQILELVLHNAIPPKPTDDENKKP